MERETMNASRARATLLNSLKINQNCTGGQAEGTELVNPRGNWKDNSISASLTRLPVLLTILVSGYCLIECISQGCLSAEWEDCLKEKDVTILITIFTIGID